MWFEILPVAFIIGAAIGFPTIGILVINRIGYGNFYRRNLTMAWDRRYYQRDSRLNKDPYKQLGLEALSDSDKKKPKDDGPSSCDPPATEPKIPVDDDPPRSCGPPSCGPPSCTPVEPEEKLLTKSDEDICKSPQEFESNALPNEKHTEATFERKKEDNELKKDIILGGAGHGGISRAESTRDQMEHNVKEKYEKDFETIVVYDKVDPGISTITDRSTITIKIGQENQNKEKSTSNENKENDRIIFIDDDGVLHTLEDVNDSYSKI